MIKWMITAPIRLVGLILMCVMIFFYSSCTRQEHLIPIEAWVATGSAINWVHRGVWTLSDYMHKTYGNIEGFWKKNGIDTSKPLDLRPEEKKQ